jgi:hypothetical protein
VPAHSGQEFAADEEAAVEIDAHQAAPLLVAGFYGLVVAEDAGIVDQHLDLAVVVAQVLADRTYLPRIADIGGERDGTLAEPLGNPLQRLQVEIEHRDPQAVGEQRLGDGEPDHARGAGDQRQFIVKLHRPASPDKRTTGCWRCNSPPIQPR